LKALVPVFIRTKKWEDGRERWRKALHAVRQRSCLKRLLVKCRRSASTPAIGRRCGDVFKERDLRMRACILHFAQELVVIGGKFDIRKQVLSYGAKIPNQLFAKTVS
jgi:hypothetical protein